MGKHGNFEIPHQNFIPNEFPQHNKAGGNATMTHRRDYDFIEIFHV